MSIYKGSRKIKDVYVSTLGPNHIKYIPQDIKLELNNGTLTLKAGSKVYVPNGKNADGSLKFDVVNVPNDISNTRNLNAQEMYFVSNGGATFNMWRYCFSGATAPTFSGNYAVWYDTANNIVKYTLNAGSTWGTGFSLPVCLATSDSTQITAIDQVFNGFGYIGSTVFALPGVKVNIPSGLNSDNTLKDVEYTVPKVLTYTNTRTGVKAFVLDGTRINYDEETWWSFDDKKNMYTHPATNESYKYMQFVKVSVDNTGKITSFNPIGVKKYSKLRIVAVYKTGKRTYYKDGVEVPSSSITDFGSYKYYKNIVTTKYWKEITTGGGRKLGYYCYYLNRTLAGYFYASPKLDVLYYSNVSSNGTTFDAVSSPEQLKEFYSSEYRNLTADSVQIDVGALSSNFVTVPRLTTGDLYINTTVTEIVEGTPEDYTYTTEEVTPVEVTAADDYDYTEFVPSTQFDSSEISNQLVYNLKYDLITTANWQAVGTISGHNFFGEGTFSEYISAERSGTVTFKTPMPSGKYTWRFLYYSQVNHTFSTYKITVTYEDGTTEVVYNSSLEDTAYGGGEKVTLDLSLTFKKPVKAITNYTNSSGGGNGCYGGSGNVQLFFEGSKQ